jgi:uncharacterized protein
MLLTLKCKIKILGVHLKETKQNNFFDKNVLNMEIHQKDKREKGWFYSETEKSIVAEMAYVWAGRDRIIIDHTEVGEALKGKGARKQSVAKAVDFAREKGITIIHLCPFAKSVFDKVKEFNDIL